MRRCALLLPALFAAGAAQAQVTNSFDVHVGDVALLQDRHIQTDVGITAAQRTKMQAAANAHSQRLQEYQKQLQALGQTNPDRAKLIGFLNTLKKDVFAVLTPAQGHRLTQLTLQRIGPIALTDPIVGKQVGLTDAEKKRMVDAFNAGKAKFNTAQQAARTAAMPIAAQYKGKQMTPALQKEAEGKMEPIKSRLMTQANTISKQTDAAMLAVLTPAERAKWTALKGKTFVAK